MSELLFTALQSDFTCKEMALDPGDIAGSFHKKISAPVGAGSEARNLPKDVLTVKELLNRVPMGEGGPIPLLKMTPVCDRAMLLAITNFQSYRLSSLGHSRMSSGVVTPHGETLQVLNYNPETMPDLASKAMEHVSRVLEILSATRGALQLARFHLNKPAVPGGLPSLNTLGPLAKLNKHFHLDKSPQPGADIVDIDGIYSSMEAAIGHMPKGMRVFANDAANMPALAYAYAGGFELARRFMTRKHGAVKGNSGGTIYLCGDLQSLDDESITYAMIHELAHYVGPSQRAVAISDYGYAHKPGYDKLTWNVALRNADCYAQFAFEAINRPFILKQHEKHT